VGCNTFWSRTSLIRFKFRDIIYFSLIFFRSNRVIIFSLVGLGQLILNSHLKKDKLAFKQNKDYKIKTKKKQKKIITLSLKSVGQKRN